MPIVKPRSAQPALSRIYPRPSIARRVNPTATTPPTRANTVNVDVTGLRHSGVIQSKVPRILLRIDPARKIGHLPMVLKKSPMDLYLRCVSFSVAPSLGIQQAMDRAL